MALLEFGHVPASPVMQFQIGEHLNFVYLIIDWKSREAALVDCQRDLSRIKDVLRQNDLKLKTVLITHSHHDHVAGLADALKEFSEAVLRAHPGEMHRIQALAAVVKPLVDEEVLRIGELEVRVMHTPGHSKGECCFYMETGGSSYLFSGDTLFIRDCGRTDFADGSNTEMFASLQKIKQLPGQTVLLPGHHYVPECYSVLSDEFVRSAPLICKNVQELAGLP